MPPTTDHLSPNHGPRATDAVIDMLVLHYTGMVDADAALQRMTDSASEVSAHYMIDEDGKVFRLVDEERRAWHAGVAQWRGHDDINGRSIGIELVNPGHEFGYRAFPEPQMAALISLATAIVGHHSIPPRNVVGHSDVAPSRKEDPGELFDWKRLATAGLGLWPAEASGEPDDVPAMLASYGYDISDIDAAVTAFQRHFRTERIDGVADETCARRLAGLLSLID
ncbi:MAG: N-acetylmuramoyl-L-alanine amidase [Alphaproteobacteria bacterium]|nr:N-acetylmuramoyl-L-alanine amidase [Alphaproteobacteria bacterium]